MNGKLLSLLEEYLASGDARGWLEGHPEHRGALQPYLDLDAGLRTRAGMAPEPRATGMQEGQRKLMAAVAARPPKGRLPAWATAPARVAAVLVVVALAFGLAAGASALAGNNLAQDVLDTLGVADNADEGINNASANAERGRECASPNAFQGRGNAEERAANADDAKDRADCARNDETDIGTPDHELNANANPNASEKSGNADDGRGNANENADRAGDHPNDNASEGSKNAEDGSDNAPDDHGPPDSVPPPHGGPNSD